MDNSATGKEAVLSFYTYGGVVLYSRLEKSSYYLYRNINQHHPIPVEKITQQMKCIKGIEN
jgi:hypothetical protein